jgi:hypothetical protein
LQGNKSEEKEEIVEKRKTNMEGESRDENRKEK